MVWSQLGTTLAGESAGDYSGWSVSLSDDGTIVAIGAYGNDKNGDEIWNIDEKTDGNNQLVRGEINAPNLQSVRVVLTKVVCNLSAYGEADIHQGVEKAKTQGGRF